MSSNNWNSVELRDNRYNQIIHMVSAANGAEEFYTTEVCKILFSFILNTSRKNTLKYVSLIGLNKFFFGA